MESQSLAALAAADIPQAVLEAVAVLKARGHHAFLVGGCVRDLLRGEKPKDWDVASDATPDQVMRVFKRVIPTGVEHGTVTVVQGKLHVEVTTFRAESEYQDGRRPSKVEFHGDIEADLSRRDFTINAIAYDPQDKRLVDPFGGQADLARKLVRCVRDPNERFAEDGLRPLRAARFATVLDFALDPATEAAIAPTIPVFKKVAAERMNQELVKLLLSPRAPKGLDILQRTGLLAAFFPEAEGHDFAAVGRAPESLPVRLAILLLGVGAPREVVLRLKFPNKVADAAAHLVAHRALPAAAVSDPTLRRWAARVGLADAPALLDLARALGDDVSALRERVEALTAARPPLAIKELALDGKAIMAALGVGPSPVVGEASRYLLELVLDDPAKNTSQALEKALAERFPRP